MSRNILTKTYTKHIPNESLINIINVFYICSLFHETLKVWPAVEPDILKELCCTAFTHCKYGDFVYKFKKSENLKNVVNINIHHFVYIRTLIADLTPGISTY